MGRGQRPGWRHWSSAFSAPGSASSAPRRREGAPARCPACDVGPSRRGGGAEEGKGGPAGRAVMDPRRGSPAARRNSSEGAREADTPAAGVRGLGVGGGPSIVRRGVGSEVAATKAAALLGGQITDRVRGGGRLSRSAATSTRPLACPGGETRRRRTPFTSAASVLPPGASSTSRGPAPASAGPVPLCGETTDFSQDGKENRFTLLSPRVGYGIGLP